MPTTESLNDPGTSYTITQAAHTAWDSIIPCFRMVSHTLRGAQQTKHPGAYRVLNVMGDGA